MELYLKSSSVQHKSPTLSHPSSIVPSASVSTVWWRRSLRSKKPLASNCPTVRTQRSPRQRVHTTLYCIVLHLYLYLYSTCFQNDILDSKLKKDRTYFAHINRCTSSAAQHIDSFPCLALSIPPLLFHPHVLFCYTVTHRHHLSPQDAINSFMESVKQKDLLVNVLGVVKEELPEVYAALIGTHTSTYISLQNFIKLALLTSTSVVSK